MNQSSDTTPTAQLVPATLAEAGATAAAMLDPVTREQWRRDRFRHLEGEFADGFNAYAMSTHEGAR